MSAQSVLERAQLAGVFLRLEAGHLRLSGDKSAVANLLPDLRNHRAQLVQLLSKNTEDQTPKGPSPVPTPDPGLPRLMAMAMKCCDYTQASEKDREQWRADIEATPPELRGDLMGYLRTQLSDPTRKGQAPAVAPDPTPATATTWQRHDQADQAHYWNCPQCLTVVKTGIGQRCATGQQLHDAYIEAATREGRFVGAKKPSTTTKGVSK